MKRNASTWLCITCLLFFLAGCGGGTETSSNSASSATQGGNPPKTVELKLSNVLPDDNPTTQALQFFADRVKEKTNGTVEIKLFNNSQLGGQREAMEGMQVGSMEMAMVSAGPAAQFVPTLNVLSLPYIFESKEHMFKALNGEAGQKLKEDINKAGFTFLMWADGGSRNIITKDKPVYTPEDLKGLKIRVMNSQLMVDALNSMGAIATPMEQGEVYTAIEQGVLDGWENNPVTLLTLKLYEVSKAFSWTQHFMVPDMVLISDNVFQKLSPEQQQAIKEAAAEAEAKQRELWDAYIGNTVKELESHGVTFTEIDDLSPFIEQAKPIWNSYKEQYGSELITLIEQAKQK